LAIVTIKEDAGVSGSYQQEENIDTDIGHSNVSGYENAANSTDSHTESPSVDEQPFYTSDIYDPRNWDNLYNKARDIGKRYLR
jgi:hypothetical protein